MFKEAFVGDRIENDCFVICKMQKECVCGEVRGWSREGRLRLIWLKVVGTESVNLNGF